MVIEIKRQKGKLTICKPIDFILHSWQLPVPFFKEKYWGLSFGSPDLSKNYTPALQIILSPYKVASTGLSVNLIFQPVMKFLEMVIFSWNITGVTLKYDSLNGIILIHNWYILEITHQKNIRGFDLTRILDT